MIPQIHQEPILDTSSHNKYMCFQLEVQFETQSPDSGQSPGL